MRRPIIPPILLTVAIASPLRIIATKNSATVIKETDTSWSSARVVSINTKTSEMKYSIPNNIQPNEPEWFANYE